MFWNTNQNFFFKDFNNQDSFDASPQSKATSPLHIVNKTTEETSPTAKMNINKDSNRLSRDDFSYLSSQMSPMPGAWTIPENNTIKYKQGDFDDIIESSNHSEGSSLSNYYTDSEHYNLQNIKNNSETFIQGILQDTSAAINADSNSNSKSQLSLNPGFESPIKDNKLEPEDFDETIGLESKNYNLTNSATASPTKSLNFQLNSDGTVNTNNLNFHMSQNEINNSNILNSFDKSEDLNFANPGEHNKIDEDATPIVGQNGFQIDDITPIVKTNRSSINNEDLKLSSEAITEIFETDTDTVAQNLYTRNRSISSATSSELRNDVSIIGSNNNNHNNLRAPSTSSSLYPESMNHKSIGPESIKRASALKLTLHKHLSTSVSEIDNESNSSTNENTLTTNTNDDEFKIPPRALNRSSSTTSRCEPVIEDVPLNFNNSNSHSNSSSSLPKGSIKVSSENVTQSKPRVSVLNQSIYKDQYDSQTGLSNTKSQYNKISRVSESSKTDLSFLSSKPSDSLFSLDDDEEDASALFVTAIYAFNSESLESENDSSICLSFDQDEIAFTYNLDDSGWGEVTLLSSLKRGWVPMNYFRSTVSNNFTDSELKEMPAKKYTETRSPLKLLLNHAGSFLLNPQSKPVYINNELRGYTFDVECFNGITDGLRKLLIETNCISRANSVVQTKPVVRKMRKKLLRGWADLIAKAKDYMGTIATPKIEYLQLLTFHLLQKAITFLDIWGLEQDLLNESGQVKSLSSDNTIAHLQNNSPNYYNSVNIDIIYLDKPPIASYRINEIYNQLISYLCLVSGRIDLVEHNPKGFDIMSVVIGHINLLVNEYFFIIKLFRTSMNEMESSENLARTMSKYGKLASNFNIKNQLQLLDTNTEYLKKLVDDLNRHIKILTTQPSNNQTSKNLSIKKQANLGNQSTNLYFYSREGGSVVVCCCKMIEISSHAYRGLKSIVNFNSDMVLPNSRRYPNYLIMNITPKKFIKECTEALISDPNIKSQVNHYKKLSMLPSKDNSKNNNHNNNRASNRYSIFKTGNSNDAQLSSTGLDFFSNVDSKTASSSPFMSQEEFEDPSQTDDLTDYEFNVENELVRSEKNGKIIGASFRALIYLLTDETNPPDYFYISTFFLTFRIFADSAQLLDALIKRFDVNNSYKKTVHTIDITVVESKLRSRRKLVVKAFQLWLESYWNSKADYIMLAPLMNFFNEGMKESLPIETYQLLVTASKLIGRPPIENVNDKLSYYNNMSSTQQLLPRKISSKLHKKTVSRMSLGVNPNGIIGEIEAYNAFLDDIETYDLEKVDSDDSNNQRSSLSLSLNLELKNSTATSVLLTKQQVSMIKVVIMSYRRMLGNHWNKNHRDNLFEPLSTQVLIESWWRASQESWKILNDDLTLLNFNGLEIAKQLTLIESKMFNSIQVNELLNQNFTTKKLHLNLSPNIQKSILFTNLLSDYVIESILKPSLQMKQRIHAFKCWLKIAISCLYLRNFNSLASIMTSLQSFLITRIPKIWSGVSDKYKELFQYLASIIHPNKNYITYRNRLKDFLSTNLQDNLDIPTVPYLSLFLQDLTFIVDGNPNYRTNTKSFLDEKLINVDKYSKITEIISDIQILQISYKDIGELGKFYNDKNTDIVRSETIKNLKNQLDSDNDVSFADMFDITGVPILQELILLEIWKVKQTNSRDDDRSWKLSCAIQPRETET